MTKWQALAVQNSYELIYIWSIYICLFSIWTTRKMHDFQGYVSRTFQVLEFSRKKIQDFPGGMGTLYFAISTVNYCSCTYLYLITAWIIKNYWLKFPVVFTAFGNTKERKKNTKEPHHTKVERRQNTGWQDALSSYRGCALSVYWLRKATVCKN